MKEEQYLIGIFKFWRQPIDPTLGNFAPIISWVTQKADVSEWNSVVKVSVVGLGSM